MKFSLILLFVVSAAILVASSNNPEEERNLMLRQLANARRNQDIRNQETAAQQERVRLAQQQMLRAAQERAGPSNRNQGTAGPSNQQQQLFQQQQLRAAQELATKELNDQLCAIIQFPTLGAPELNRLAWICRDIEDREMDYEAIEPNAVKRFLKRLNERESLIPGQRESLLKKSREFAKLIVADPNGNWLLNHLVHSGICGKYDLDPMIKDGITAANLDKLLPAIFSAVKATFKLPV